MGRSSGRRPAPRSDGRPPRWSGRLALTGSGWTVGTATGQRRICRYVGPSADRLASEGPFGHPPNWIDVDRALLQQNYLMVDGAQACPAGDTAVPPFLATVQHQP